MEKRMKATANAPKDFLRLKDPATSQVPTDDEETTSGPIFTRKRKALTAPTTEHSHSDGCASSQHVAPSHHAAPSHHIVPSKGQNPARVWWSSKRARWRAEEDKLMGPKPRRSLLHRRSSAGSRGEGKAHDSL